MNDYQKIINETASKIFDVTENIPSNIKKEFKKQLTSRSPMLDYLINQPDTDKPKSRTSALLDSNKSESILKSIERNTSETVGLLKSKDTAGVKVATPNVGNSIKEIFDEKIIGRFADKARSVFFNPDTDDTSEGAREKLKTEEKQTESLSQEEKKIESLDEEIVKELKKSNELLEKLVPSTEAKLESKDRTKKPMADQLLDSAKDKVGLGKEFNLKDYLLDKLNPFKNNKLPIPDEVPEIDIDNDKKKPTTESNRKNKKRSARQSKKIRARNPRTPDIIPEEIVPDVPNIGKKPVQKSVTKPGIISKAGQAMNAAKLIGSAPLGLSAGSLALGGAGVLAAGVAGYGVGTMLNQGIGSAIGYISGESGQNASRGLGERIGGGLYDLLHPDDSKTSSVIPMQKPNNIAPIKNNQIQSIVATAARNDTMSAAVQNKQMQPIVLNNTSSNSTPAPAPVIIGSSSVRNRDSTFERVQMQDFWPRVA